MTAITKSLKIHQPDYESQWERTADRSPRTPIRPCMVLSISLILAGMGLVLLMVLQIVPVTFLTAFLGFALTAIGGTMSLIFCGDI